MREQTLALYMTKMTVYRGKNEITDENGKPIAGNAIAAGSYIQLDPESDTVTKLLANKAIVSAKDHRASEAAEAEEVAAEKKQKKAEAEKASKKKG